MHTHPGPRGLCASKRRLWLRVRFDGIIGESGQYARTPTTAADQHICTATVSSALEVGGWTERYARPATQCEVKPVAAAARCVG